MKSRFGADGRFRAEENEPHDLAQFEAALRRLLEQRVVESAQSPSEPTPDEARQLARMAAHMEESDRARRPRPLQPVVHTRAVVGATPKVAVERGQRRVLLRTYVTLAAVALGVAFVRGPAAGPDLGTPPKVDLTARGSSTSGAGPQNNEVYLAGKGAGTGSTEFPGRVTWDPRGQDGVVLVSVFDLDGDRREPVFVEQVEGSEWTPNRPLPKRFRVVVDRPADDGVSREELHWKDYDLP